MPTNVGGEWSRVQTPPFEPHQFPPIAPVKAAIKELDDAARQRMLDRFNGKTPPSKRQAARKASKATFKAPYLALDGKNEEIPTAKAQKPGDSCVSPDNLIPSEAQKLCQQNQSSLTVRASALFQKEKEVKAWSDSDLQDGPRNFGQPIISHLPVNLDVLRWDGRIDIDSPLTNHLLYNPDRRTIPVGDFKLVPIKKVWSWRLSYDIRAPTKSDAIARILMHHECKRSNAIQIEIYSETFSHPDGLTLCADLWEMLKPEDEKLNYVEIKGFSPLLVNVPNWIRSNNAVKKNAKPGTRTKNGLPTVQIGSIAKNGPGQIIDPNGDAERMTVGHESSARRFSIYPGKNLAARGKKHQIQFIEDNREPGDNTPAVESYGIEARIGHKEGHRCLIDDGKGGERPIKTLREWANTGNVKAVFRTQIETGFDFRIPNPDKPGKMVDVSFFDWNKIGAARLTRTPRKKSLSYSAKQATKRLKMDGRKGDYLVKGLKTDIAPALVNHVCTPANINLLLDTVDSTVDSTVRRLIVGHWLESVTTGGAGLIAEKTPDLVARLISAEYETAPFYYKTRYKARSLPDVDRPLETLRTLNVAA